MKKIWRKRSLVLLVAGVLQVTNAGSQEVVWIGQPTVGEFLAFNAQRAVEQYGELRQQMAQFESQIAEARRAYFTAPAASRAAAGNTFGKLLFQKDILIAWPRVVASGDQAQLMTNLVMLGNGGRPVDGGIPPSASKAFNDWVRAVRASAGSGGGIFGANPDPASGTAAVLSSNSQKEYETYRRLRDQAERDDWNAQGKATGRELLQPGQVISARAFFGDNPSMPRFDWEVKQLGAKILRCEYGGRQAEGSIYYFWQGQPPVNIGTLLALNASGLSRVKDHAVEQCPANSSEARAIESSRPKTVVTTEMAREASASRYSVPRDPGQARDIQNQNAASRQQREQRTASIEDRKARFQVCSAAFQANRYTHDRAVLTAARQQYSECMRNASRSGYP